MTVQPTTPGLPPTRLLEGGVVALLKLDGVGGAQQLTVAELDAAMGSGTVWMHLDYEAEGVETWLDEHAGLPHTVASALVAEDPRPRSLVIQDGLLVILRGVNANAGSDPEDMVSLRLWIRPDRIISVRRRRLASIRELQEELAAGEGPRDAGTFLSELVDALVGRIATAVGAVDDEADELEDRVVGEHSRELRGRLGALRRKCIALRRYLAPQRDTLSHLFTERITWLSDFDRSHLRESAERIARCVEDLDSARDRAAVTQEELNNRLAEEMNRTMYVLSVVAAIFLPLGFVTGLLGINVGGIPGTEWPWSFTVVCVALLVMAGGLAEFFRRRRML